MIKRFRKPGIQLTLERSGVLLYIHIQQGHHTGMDIYNAVLKNLPDMSLAAGCATPIFFLYPLLRVYPNDDRYHCLPFGT